MWAFLLLIGALGCVTGKPGVNTTRHRDGDINTHPMDEVALGEIQHKYLDVRPANASFMKFDWLREKKVNGTHRVVPALSLTESHCPLDTTYDDTGYYDSHHPYSNDIYDCIQIDVYERINIEWDEEFQVEPHSNGCWDKVIITEMVGLPSEIVHPAICGTVAPAPQEFEGPLLITFQTDGSVAQHGFRLNWEVMWEQDYCPEDTVTYINGNYESVHPYHNDAVDCAFVNLEGLFTFSWDEQFNLESSGSHCYDFVNIIEAVGTSQEQEYGPFCGSTAPGPLYDVIGPILLEFITDGSVTRHGFKLNWVQTQTTSPPVQPTICEMFPSWYYCSDNSCIHPLLVCDGIHHCSDDEYNCSEQPPIIVDPPAPCNSDEVMCGNGNCIPQSWWCDDYTDCDNDETNCHNTPTGCASHQTECGDGSCILTSYLCDGYHDCNDDEEHCDNTPTGCESHEVECGDGTCIPSNYMCDGYHDCDDDEAHCDNTPTGCTSGQTECGDGDCIPDTYVCDGITDCNDDEINCGNPPDGCTSSETECGDGTCIPNAFVCDGHNDCNDDEEHCGGSNCDQGEVRCGNGECIHDYYWCDGYTDCNDDELHCP